MTHLNMYMLNQRKLRDRCVLSLFTAHRLSPYSRSFLDEFATCVNEIVVTRQNILIVGDFNLHCEHNSVPDVKILNDI